MKNKNLLDISGKYGYSDNRFIYKTNERDEYFFGICPESCRWWDCSDRKKKEWEEEGMDPGGRTETPGNTWGGVGKTWLHVTADSV